MNDQEKLKNRLKEFMAHSNIEEIKKFFDDLLEVRPDMTGLIREELEKLSKKTG